MKNMKERPILFSTPMVKAILEGRKTVTRRVLSQQPKECNHNEFTEADWKGDPTKWVCDCTSDVDWYCGLCGNGHGWIKCPYGKVGDILWVKETFTVIDYWEDSKSVQVMYEDGDTRVCQLKDSEWNKFMKWQDRTERKPSIFMFRSLSRISLEIIANNIERPQDITEEDAIREGVLLSNCADQTPIWKIPSDDPKHRVASLHSAKLCYEKLWCSINGEESWSTNPWVWRIKFKKI